MPDAGIASALGVATFFFLVLVFLTLLLVRVLENRLILLGLLTAVLGLLYGWLSGLHVGSGQGNVSVNVGAAGGAAVTMMKIGFLLVLGGVAVALFGRGEIVPAVSNRQEGQHV